MSLYLDICSSTVLNSSAWLVYYSINCLKACNKIILIDFTLFNNLLNPNTYISIAVYMADLSNSLSTITNSSSISILCLLDININNIRIVIASLELA
jgi:hypothetical protein